MREGSVLQGEERSEIARLGWAHANVEIGLMGKGSGHGRQNMRSQRGWRNRAGAWASGVYASEYALNLLARGRDQ